MNLLQFFVILICVGYSSSQKTCNSRKSCGACIGHAAEQCVWCSEGKNITDFRCQPILYSVTHIDWCQTDNILSSEIINKNKQNSPFSDTVQLRPQEILIKARPGEVINFTLSYKPAKDFPLDVYFLMDYTYTMKTHVQLLQKQLRQIYQQLTKLTNNVKLGVGSFIEKPGLPYADAHVSAVYVFKNHLSLTNDTTAFERLLYTTPVFGSNYDDAEAGLDALMQVMKCTKELGWRKDTKRIIVLATDNTYHSAGDGKMLGAFKPNDMKCHLEDNEYKREYSLVYDYPSVSQINKVATDGHFLIIFAALRKVQQVYTRLSEQIQASSYAELKEKSNIMEIIQNEYSKSVSAIKIRSQAPTSFQVTIDQICPSENTGNCTNCKETRNCESTPNNTVVTIPVYIRSKECPTSNKPDKITFSPENGLGDKVIVIFEIDCECECEKSHPSDATRDKCNKRGFIQCGACKCDEDWGGDTCEINCSDDKSMILEKKCYPTNSTNKCYGHGTCECGKCLCTEGFTGDLCEYDPSSCDSGKNGRICSGHGTCEFGECSCESDWTGKACDCLKGEKSLEKCTGPFSKKRCSGNGNCECGTCNCYKKNDNEMYTGAFCDFCEDCAIERCKELEDYAKCNHNKTKDFCDNKFDLTNNINLEVIVANISELVQKNEWTTGTQCRTELDDGTFLLFKYSANTRNDMNTETKKMLLMIQKEVEVPPKVDILVPIASVIAAILLIGLLTIVFWKVLIEWYDKREYIKFCNEAKSQGFDVSPNPLYEPPTQTFINPACDQNI